MKSEHFPKYCRQGSRAYIKLDGQRFYLGRFGSPESKAEYARRLAEWTANGGRLKVPDNEITIVELCDRYAAHADAYYAGPDGNPSNEAKHMHAVLATLRALYGRTPAAAFGPLRFKAVRENLSTTPQQKGDKSKLRSRQYVNALSNRLRRIFKWAAENEIVPPSVWHGLKAVAALKRGRCDLAETEPVTPVAESVVAETRAYMTPTVAAMVRLQELSGMRPGEVCALRTADLNMSGKVWTFEPKEHKTAYRGRTRTVYFGPKAQAILEPWLCKELEACMFSPAQSERERLKARNEARTTPLSCGNTPGSNRERRPQKQPADRWTVPAYRRAIEYATKRAGQPKWHPNQLRHSFATMVRREHGLEAAQVLLGHAAADVTQVYAERDVAKAVQVAAAIG